MKTDPENKQRRKLDDELSQSGIVGLHVESGKITTQQVKDMLPTLQRANGVYAEVRPDEGWEQV